MSEEQKEDEKQIVSRNENEGTFARLDSRGKIEIVNEKTGEVIAREGRTYAEIVKEPYNQVLADLICNEIMEGTPLTRICAREEMPSYSTIARWRKHHEYFNEAIQSAYEGRAHYYHDKAIEVAEITEYKEDVPAAKLKIDTYKWAAERGNQNQFGARQTAAGPTTATQIIIQTGVPQSDSVSVSAVEKTVKILGDELGEAEANIIDIESTVAGSGESVEGIDE